MVRIPRRVRKIPDPSNESNGSIENPIENLAGFRSDAAWVLLGEPGMGKTTAFQMEAEATDGECLRIEEFIHLDIEPEWREKTLFLDGLDEVRAGNDGESILLRLHQRLKSLGNPRFRIACRAADWYGSTDRADIRLSYRTEFELPIEIKRDSNASLWTALRSQLIAQYSIAPRADGHGIYLVLWFDGKDMPRTTDGGKKPCSPEELKIRLEAQLNPIEKQRIFVRVLDVSWPAGELKPNHSNKGTMQTAGKRASQTQPHGGG